MTRRTLTLAACLALFALPAAAAEKAAPAFQIEQLAFLAGSWRISGEVTIEEQWLTPAGGTMIGMSRVHGHGQTFFFEFLRIETRDDGIYYVPQPKGGPATDFKLVKLDATGAVFENLQHDFPKRILYRREGPDAVTARVEGDGTEKEKPEEFPYQRVACKN